ncbi:hypothetical protein E4T50_10872 [Aureobasidium sp. EXF-12298]|nr:hypothetical protein E4T50_10872 [Aureobasidium sp. EXF-12298]KAI4756199.1 hypothetical protein E4T51_10714 [Aureobasidium sp. EXF-12344]KAI4773310.1 hypothetical protein E4T52_11709 [Aureobasidium sp. EXF-3400]
MSANNFTGTNPSGANHPTATHTTATTTSGTKGAEAGQGLKGVFAKGHGIGESIRGNINSAIDGFTGDSASLAKNEQVARGGEQEFQTGSFVKKGTTDKAL